MKAKLLVNLSLLSLLSMEGSAMFDVSISQFQDFEENQDNCDIIFNDLMMIYCDNGYTGVYLTEEVLSASVDSDISISHNQGLYYAEKVQAPIVYGKHVSYIEPQ